MRRALSVAAIVAVVTALAGACSAFGDGPDQQPCKDIPAGGCPGGAIDGYSADLNCQDLSCTAIYSCDADAGWVFVAKCAPHDGGVPEAHITSPDANLRRDSDWDVPVGASGGNGCVELQAPDCSLGLALACPVDECCCCETVYVCDDGGWNVWGYCEDGGALMTSGPLKPDE
jgi:hypothetical protein